MRSEIIDVTLGYPNLDCDKKMYTLCTSLYTAQLHADLILKFFVSSKIMCTLSAQTVVSMKCIWGIVYIPNVTDCPNYPIDQVSSLVRSETRGGWDL